MRSRRHRVVLALALTTMVLLTMTGIAQAVTTIQGFSTSWSPTKVSIHVGQKVRWTAVSGNHTIKSYSANWSYFRTLDAGTSCSRTFNNTGVFKFVCTLHGSVSAGICSGMCGRVRVT